MTTRLIIKNILINLGTFYDLFKISHHWEFVFYFPSLHSGMLQVFMCLKWRSLVRLHRTKRLLNMSTTRIRLEDWHFYFLDNVLYLCALKHIICTLRLLCLAKLFIWLHDSLICPSVFWMATVFIQHVTSDNNLRMSPVFVNILFCFSSRDK